MIDHGGKRKGSGRKAVPTNEKRVSLTITIRPDLKNTLKSLDGSISGFVENAIIRELQRIGQFDDGAPPTDEKT